MGAVASGQAVNADVRYVGSINGCYTLSSRREAAATTGGVEVFACRVLSISPTQVTVTAPVLGSANERLTSKIEGIGIIAGRIVRLIPDGFAYDVDASPEEREKLAARIAWLKRNRVKGEIDRREHKRIMPRDPRSTLTLEDGSRLTCMLVDVSRSGAALSADLQAQIGMPLVVGRVAAKVVRRLEVGFAVQFDTLQDIDAVEAMLCDAKAAPLGEPVAIAAEA